MKNKVLLDTNILVYAVDESSDFHIRSWEILNNNNYQFYLSPKNISEFISVVTRSTKPMLSVESAVEIIDTARKNYSVLYPNNSSLDILSNLLKKYKAKGLRVYDLEIISVALANNIETIATFNYKDFDRITEIKTIQR